MLDGIGFGGCQADRLPGPVRFWLPRRMSLVGGAASRSSRMMPTVLSCLTLKKSSKKPNRPLALAATTVRRYPPARWWTLGETLHGYRAAGRARGGPNLEWPVICHWRCVHGGGWCGWWQVWCRVVGGDGGCGDRWGDRPGGRRPTYGLLRRRVGNRRRAADLSRRFNRLDAQLHRPSRLACLLEGDLLGHDPLSLRHPRRDAAPVAKKRRRRWKSARWGFARWFHRERQQRWQLVAREQQQQALTRRWRPTPQPSSLQTCTNSAACVCSQRQA